MSRHLSVVPDPIEPKVPIRDGEYDLPPMWDDRAAVWDDWTREPWTSASFHIPIGAFACRRCGVVDQKWSAKGVVAVLPSITHSQIRAAQAARKVGKYALVRLYATRCHCGHDTVLDFETNDLWDLDPDDYGPQGSLHPDTIQETLF